MGHKRQYLWTTDGILATAYWIWDCMRKVLNTSKSTESRRFLSFVNDLLGIITCGFNLLRCLYIGGALFHMCCFIIVFLENQNAVRTSTLFFWLHIERLFNNNKTQRYFNRVKSMLIESQKVKINWYLRFIYLGISASCILTEPFFIYCNCLNVTDWILIKATYMYGF